MFAGGQAGPQPPKVQGKAHHVHRGVAGEIQGKAAKVCHDIFSGAKIYKYSFLVERGRGCNKT